MNDTKLHPTAVVSPNAQIGVNVEIGAYSIIGDGVIIGDNTVIMHHCVIDQYTRIGAGCVIYNYASIGTDPQDLTFKGELTYVEIGQNNRIREFCTINRGTGKGGGITSIGDGNYFMAYSHIAHDCKVGHYTTFINGATLAGHVEIENYAVIGAFSSVHQFCRIGCHAYIGGYSVILQDIPPFAKVAQNRDTYNFYGPNSIGMMRRGISRDFINNVKEIFEVLYRQDLNTTQALEKLKTEYADLEEAALIIEFISKTKRGLLKNFRHGLGG